MSSIWFYNVPYHGHVTPTLPLTRALVDAGEDVTYFSLPAFEESIASTGARFRPYVPASAFPPTRSTSHPLALGSDVAEATRELLPGVLADVERERPNLIVFDMSAPWGAIASRRLGVPAVASFPHLPFCWRAVMDDRRVMRRVLLGMRAGSGAARGFASATWRAVRELHLSRTEANLLSSSAELNIVFSSRYFQPHADRFGPEYVFVGPEIDRSREEEALGFSLARDRPVVYVAVGTVYEAPEAFFHACFEALGDQRMSVVMSVGKAVEPGDLGPPPGNFVVRQYVPQLAVLAVADVFVTHGGMNSISEAVTYGVPMVVVPNTVEQAVNAARIEQLGAGVYLESSAVTPNALREAVGAVKSEATVAGLSRIADSFEAAGGVERALEAMAEVVARSASATSS